jgi:TonB family protein
MRFQLAAAAVIALGLLSPGIAVAAHNGAAHVDLTAQNAPVSYPLAAQRSGRQGVVRMLVQVAETGVARRVRVVRSSGYEDLDDAAAAGVMRWHYVPATWGSDWADVQVEYKLPPLAPAPANP